jgi:hypothetical protein
MRIEYACTLLDKTTKIERLDQTNSSLGFPEAAGRVHDRGVKLSQSGRNAARRHR